MLPIQTIVSDMDDTLLTDEMILAPATQRVLRRCMERGIRVILASGRAAASLRPFVKQLDTRAPYICCNGAQTRDGVTDKMLVDLQFDLPLGLECARFFEAEGMYAQYYDGEHFCYNQESDFARQYEALVKMQGVHVGPLDQALNVRTPKILGVDAPDRIEKAFDKARMLFGDRVSVTRSKPYFLELNPAGTTKGGALEKLAQLVDLNPETTLAFGDSLNDISMLTWAKYGVAVGNAWPQVKAAVSLTCDTNQNQGVARFICEHVLGEEFEA